MTRCIACSMITVILAAALALADDHEHKKDTPKNPGFEKMKTLVGEWVAIGEDGKPTDKVVSVFKITSAGTAIQETIFPGSDHEMVTMYHINGKDLVATHYCALGNQPHLKLDQAALPNKLKFDFNGGSNMDPAKDMHMHEGSYTITDADHIEANWQGWENGKPAAGHKMSMKLARKKK